MVQYFVDIPPAASTLEIRWGMDSISAEQYSAVISVHHAFFQVLQKFVVASNFLRWEVEFFPRSSDDKWAMKTLEWMKFDWKHYLEFEYELFKFCNIYVNQYSEDAQISLHGKNIDIWYR